MFLLIQFDISIIENECVCVCICKSIQMVELIFSGESKCSHCHSLCSVINITLSTIDRFALKWSAWYSRVCEIQALRPAFDATLPKLCYTRQLVTKHSGLLLSSEPLLLFSACAMPFPS